MKNHNLCIFCYLLIYCFCVFLKIHDATNRPSLLSAHVLALGLGVGLNEEEVGGEMEERVGKRTFPL